MNFKTVKTQIVEIPVTANSTLTKFNFNTENFLRSKQIISIEAYTVNDYTDSPLGNTLPTSDNFKSAYLYLYGDNPEDPGAKGVWLQGIPMWNLHRLNNLTDPYVFELFELVPRVIVWEKSYITTQDVLGNTVNLSWMLNVGYIGNEGD